MRRSLTLPAGGSDILLHAPAIPATLSGIVIAWVLLLQLAGNAVAGPSRVPANPLNDVVAVGYARGKILLGAVAEPARQHAWRFRRIAITPPTGMPREIELSSGGSQMLVAFPGAVPRVVDLTEKITSLSAATMVAPQHRVPRQLFFDTNQGTTCLLNDVGARLAPCRNSQAAAVNDDGRVLYALSDGRLVIANRDGGEEQHLPYALPPHALYRLLAGPPGGTHAFLVLLAGNRTSIIDPVSNTTLGEYRNPLVAGLRAELDFAADGGAVSDSDLEAWAAHLEAQALPAHATWSFYLVTADPKLYAPVLEFAHDEPIYPSDVNIWKDINPPDKSTSFGAYEGAYRALGDRRWASCSVYVRTLSYPGTWLEEYWYYYPFDQGHPHAHFHDSEHLFVEVDKLGGTVRNVFASDHDSFVPNNLYSTLVPGAAPVALPLYAMVERGKHAMAPDLDHDGRFEPGIDDNLHLPDYAFWGIRDRTSARHFLLEPYHASLGEPRYRADRFALQSAAATYPGLDVPADHQICRLRPFPENNTPCEHCAIPTAQDAVAHLVDHRDARDPENIYKPYVLPWRELRVGMDLYDWLGDRRAIAVSYVGDFQHMSGGLLRLPLRVGLDSMWNPFPEPVEVPGPQRIAHASSSLFAGAHVERLVTPSQGFYFGATVKWSNVPWPGPGAAAASRWQYGGLAYRAGYMVELPSARWGSLVNQVGVVLQPGPYPVLFEWRISLAILRRRGRDTFGGRVGDRNPYE